jgi:hypothetical protein
MNRWRAHSRKIRIVLGLVVLSLLYAAGVVFRQKYGICVVLRNSSGKTLRKVAVTVARTDGRGGRYQLPDLVPAGREHVFVEPVTESSIDLDFVDADDKRHTSTIDGYAESGYCGTARASILPRGDVEVAGFSPSCWKGWLDFIQP